MKQKDAEKYIEKFNTDHFERALSKLKQREIHNPVTVPYKELLRESEKGLLFLFDSGNEWWLSKALCRVNAKKKTITIPKMFAIERQLIDD